MTHKQEPYWRQLYALAVIFMLGLVMEAHWRLATDIHKLLLIGWTGIFFTLMALWVNGNQRDFAELDRSALVYPPRVVEEFLDADRVEWQRHTPAPFSENHRSDSPEEI